MDVLRNVGIVSGLSTVFVLALATAFLISHFLKPLQRVAEAGEKLSVGDFSMDLQYKSNDEIGKLMHSMGNVVHRIRSIIADLSEKLNQLAQGNFNVEMNNADPVPRRSVPVHRGCLRALRNRLLLSKSFPLR